MNSEAEARAGNNITDEVIIGNDERDGEYRQKNGRENATFRIKYPDGCCESRENRYVP